MHCAAPHSTHEHHAWNRSKDRLREHAPLCRGIVRTMLVDGASPFSDMVNEMDQVHGWAMGALKGQPRNDHLLDRTRATGALPAAPKPWTGMLKSRKQLEAEKASRSRSEREVQNAEDMQDNLRISAKLAHDLKGRVDRHAILHAVLCC